MKKRFTFNRLLHKDKLMMIVSLILAIVLWAWADAEQGNLHEVVLNNVPVQMELTKYATDKGIKITEGNNTEITVVVKGTRAELRGITAEDIRVVADTTGVYGSGVHKAKLSISTSKRCEIVEVRGDKVRNDDLLGKYVNITCKLFDERKIELSPEQVDISKLTLSDPDLMRFGKCEITDVNKVTVYGVHEDLERIKKICAVVTSGKELSATEHVKAKLVPYDADGNVVEGITFNEPSNGEVGVVVPVITYREETLAVVAPEGKTIPQGLKDKLVVNPSTITVGELSEKKVLDTYLDKIRDSLVVDFDHWLIKENETPVKPVFLLKDTDDVEVVDGVYLDRVGQNQITVALDVAGYTNQTKVITLDENNVTFVCDEGYAVELKTTSMQVTLCGPKTVLDQLSSADIRFVIDAKKEGSHKVSVRPVVERDDTWVYYGVDADTMVYEIEYTVVKAEAVSIVE